MPLLKDSTPQAGNCPSRSATSAIRQTMRTCRTETLNIAVVSWLNEYSGGVGCIFSISGAASHPAGRSPGHRCRVEIEGRVSVVPVWTVCSLSRSVELLDTGRHRRAVDRELCGAERQLEAPRSGAARVDVQHATALEHAWLMRVARYEHADSLRARFALQLRKIVYHVELDFLETDALAFRQQLRPRTLVVVAAHCRKGCDRRELLEHALRADVAGVNDVVAAAQKSAGLRPQQAVGVRDESKPQHAGTPVARALVGTQPSSPSKCTLANHSSANTKAPTLSPSISTMI